MAKRHVTFTPKTASILGNIAKDHVSGSSVVDPRNKPGNSVGKWVMKATTPITACDYRCLDDERSPIPGSGTAVICYLDQVDGKLKVHKPDGITEVAAPVSSLLNEVIPAGRFFIGTRDLAGTLWAESVFESCDAGSGGSGGSGGGSGPGSGSGCIDVVTDVRFDIYTCQLIVCTRNICFPPGTIIGPEDCGSGGSGG